MISICTLSGDGWAGCSGEVPCTTASLARTAGSRPQSATTSERRVRSAIRMSIRARSAVDAPAQWRQKSHPDEREEGRVE